MKKTCGRWSRGRSFTLAVEATKRLGRARPVDICGFIDDNRDGLDRYEVSRIRRLQRGQALVMGGGAAPYFKIKRTR